MFYWKGVKMENLNQVEILLVEDNPNDAELALRALRKIILLIMFSTLVTVRGS